MTVKSLEVCLKLKGINQPYSGTVVDESQGGFWLSGEVVGKLPTGRRGAAAPDDPNYVLAFIPCCQIEYMLSKNH